MAGLLLNLIPKRVFDFSNFDSAAPAQDILVAQRIDISQHIESILIVRVHARNAPAGSVSFMLRNDGYSEEDPGAQFFTAWNNYLVPLISITSTNPTNVPGVLSSGGIVRGQYLSLWVTGARSSTNPLSVTVSVDLLLRSPDPVNGRVLRTVQQAGGCRCA